MGSSARPSLFLQRSFPIRSRGEWIQAHSPGCHSSPPWPGWLFVSAARGTKQLVAPQTWGNLCYSQDVLPFYSKRSCAVHPLKLVRSNEKSCLSKANFSLALTGACLH